MSEAKKRAGLVRLTTGEYERSEQRCALRGSDKDSAATGRALFFGAVLAIAPPLTQSLVDLGLELSSAPPSVFRNPKRFVALQKQIRRPVREVCASFGLIDGWVIAHAAMFACNSRTLSKSDDYSKVLDGVEELLPEATRSRQWIEPKPLRIEIPDWDPQEQTWSEYVIGTQQLFDEKMTQHRLDRIRDAEAAGLLKSPEKRGLMPFVWLAAFQVARFSASAIADAENKTRRNVEQQINSLAAEIGLTLRDRKSHVKNVSADQIRSQLRAASDFLLQIPRAEASAMPVSLVRILPPAIRPRSS